MNNTWRVPWELSQNGTMERGTCGTRAQPDLRRIDWHPAGITGGVAWLAYAFDVRARMEGRAEVRVDIYLVGLMMGVLPHPLLS